MNATNFLARLTAYALIGAVVGTLVGLVLLAAGVVDNPFWLTSAGIGVGAILAPLRPGEP
jgi:uncharacterized membrane protein